MTRNDTARMPTPPFPQAREAKDPLARRIAIFSFLVSVIAACFLGWNAYLSSERNEEMIKEKIFKVEIASDWSIAINQVGGPYYAIETVRLTPTFEERDAKIAKFIDGNPVEVPLRDLENITDRGTRYVISNMQNLLCPPNQQQPGLAAKCTDTALARVKVEFDVSGDARRFICRPNSCV